MIGARIFSVKIPEGKTQNRTVQRKRNKRKILTKANQKKTKPLKKFNGFFF